MPAKRKKRSRVRRGYAMSAHDTLVEPTLLTGYSDEMGSRRSLAGIGPAPASTNAGAYRPGSTSTRTPRGFTMDMPAPASGPARSMKPPARSLPTLPRMDSYSSVEKQAFGNAPQLEVTALITESRRDLELAKTAKGRRKAFDYYLLAERAYGVAAYLAGKRFQTLLNSHVEKLAQVYHALLARMKE